MRFAMPAFIEVEDDDITDASFWAALNIDLNSTIDVSDLDDDIQVTLTANSITFTDTDSGIVTTYTDADLAGGSFSQIVEYTGNDGDSDVSGAVGLNASGYAGGEGDDTFVDDGALGGALDGGEGNDVLVGGTGDNNIDGGRGDDILRGGSGNNNIQPGLQRRYCEPAGRGVFHLSEYRECHDCLLCCWNPSFDASWYDRRCKVKRWRRRHDAGSWSAAYPLDW